MKPFGDVDKKFDAAALVKRGLANKKMANRKQVMDGIFFLANGLGETWKSVTQEAVAGMVMVALTKNTELKNLLNIERQPYKWPAI